MNKELAGILKTISRVSVMLFIAGIVLWAIVAEYRPLIAGLLLGMFASLFNLLYLGLKTQQMAEFVVQDTKKRFNLGFFTRASIAVLAVMVAYKVEQVELVTTVIGLFYAQAALFVAAAIVFFKKSN